MDQAFVETIRTLNIEVLLQSHLHAILIGRLFGVPFNGHERVTEVLQYIEQLTDPCEIGDFPKSDALNCLLDAIQDYEESVIAIAQARSPDADQDKYDKTCSSFDAALLAYQQRAYLAHLQADQVSAGDELEEELDRRGLAGKVVLSMSRRSLKERLRARKLRRRWLLHTTAGREYMRELVRRRHRHHNKDPKRVKTARQASKLYAGT